MHCTFWFCFSILLARQISEHIAHEGISNENQSGYRIFQNDIAISMDKSADVGLVLLDPSMQ